MYVVYTHQHKNSVEISVQHNTNGNWSSQLRSEIDFWDTWMASKGFSWPDDFAARQRHRPVQKHIELLLEKAVLPFHRKYRILDAGAGPLSVVGTMYNATVIDLYPVDPLAREYDVLLDKHNIVPLFRTRYVPVERLSQHFSKNFFDLSYMRNSLDHSEEPLRGIFELLRVTRQGCPVVLEHERNEAENERGTGLHRWNFDIDVHRNFILSAYNSTLRFNISDILISKGYVSNIQNTMMANMLVSVLWKM